MATPRLSPTAPTLDRLPNP
ncbi:hypothetical protein CCACVL1_02935 [Corchorus capsularis]|uniref:Uncharacterized protein n=1 Tax=Corchorus capsularis TaxID=210143 RepID=A0A1R3K4N4_COCAP|nr:hypothetical protein CCACVL1_02935 [Corchorus capsularis]